MSQNKLVLNKVPIVIKKGSNIMLNQHLFRDTIIYDSKEMNFFKGKYDKVILVNRQNILNNTCRLIAKISTLDGETVEKSSDEIVKMIGQDQFEVLFMALCSIINQEMRVRGLISILTNNKPVKLEKNDVQTDLAPKKVNIGSQTDVTRLDKVIVSRKRRMRRHLTPYVVQDYKTPEKVQRIIVDISNYDTKSNPSTNEPKEMPDLGYLHDDNSNNTVLSNITCDTTPELLTDPLSMLKDVDNCTEKTIINEKQTPINETHDNPIKNINLVDKAHEMITNAVNNLEMMQPNGFNLILPDNTSIMLPAKPEDHFHIATEENLRVVDGNSKKKLIEIQRIIDLKFCLSHVDDEGNLPIHMAVLNEDLPLLKRQCFMLDLKEISVDIEANGMTPLKLSLYNESESATNILLSFGADPLFLDESHSTYFHAAAELNTEHLSVLLHYCKNNARTLISENEDLQLPGWEEKSYEELSSHLMDHICSICNSQGYTPLMVATNLGLYNNVRCLLSHSPTSIHTISPTTGNTVLYLAVVAACNVAAERGNKSKLVDNFRQTIEILLDYGADPTIDNYSGSNISVLLTDFQCPELSMLIANRGPASKYNDSPGNYNSLMLIKDGDEIIVNKMNDKNKKTMQLKNVRKVKDRPVVLESLVLSERNSGFAIKNEGQTDSAITHTDSTKTHYGAIEIDIDSVKNYDKTNVSHDLKNDNLNSKHAASTKTISNKMNIESDSIIKTDSNPIKSIKIESDSIIKTDSNPIIPEIILKMNQFKNPSLTKNILESKTKISPKNIIVNKPDKIILTPVKLIDVDKSNPNKINTSNDSIEKIDPSINQIDKIDSLINPIKKAIIRKVNNIKGFRTQKIITKSGRPIANQTFTEFDPKSIEMPSSIRFLYSPNSIKNKKSAASVSNAIQSSTQSINRGTSEPESLSVMKTQKVYLKKTIPSTKKAVRKKCGDDDLPVPLKTYKRKISESE